MGDVRAWLGSLSSEKRDYALKHTPSHLADAGKVNQLFRCLTDFDFIEAKVSGFGVQALIEDYDLANSLEPPQPPLLRGEQENVVHFSLFQEGQGGELKEKEEILRLIQGAIRLSAHVVDKDKTQLAGQLCGRLICFKTPDIQTLLEQAKPQKQPWLCPLTPTLTPPGGSLLRTLTGHTDWVNAVVITPDGQLIVSASRDKTLKVWDLQSGVERFTLTGHTDGVNAVAISPDGQLIVSRSGYETIKVWDLQSGAQVKTLTGYTSGVNAVLITPNGQLILFDSWSGAPKLWDLQSGTQVKTKTFRRRTYGTYGVNAVAITPDGQFIVSASYDKTLKVWNLQSGAEVKTLTGYTGGVNAVAISPDGQLLVSASYDKTLKVWNLQSGAQVKTLTGHTAGINGVVITPDGQLIVSASEDNTLKVWELESSKEIASFTGDSGLTCCAVAPDGVTIVAGEVSGRVHFLRLEGVAGHGF